MKLLSVFAVLSTVWAVSASPASLPDRTKPTNVTVSPDAILGCNCQGSYTSYRESTNVVLKLSKQAPCCRPLTLETHSSKGSTMAAAGTRLISHHTCRVGH